MSKTIVDRSSVLLGSGDVFVLDAVSGNYGNHEAISTKNDLLCRMENIRISIKKSEVITKKIVNGFVMDDEIYTNKMEFFLEFEAYEHNLKTQSVLFGGGVLDVSLALSSLMLVPKSLRFEVKFTFPVGNKAMWYILPKCKAVSDFDFSPGNTEGFRNKGVFRALPAVSENTIWYTTSTPCFHNYII